MIGHDHQKECREPATVLVTGQVSNPTTTTAPSVWVKPRPFGHGMSKRACLQQAFADCREATNNALPMVSLKQRLTGVQPNQPELHKPSPFIVTRNTTFVTATV